MRSMWLALLFTFCSALAACNDASLAQDFERPAFPHAESNLKPDARIIYGELDNGLRYAVMENDTPENTASMRFRIAAGSLNEADGEEGIAHFLEHMAFNGSKNVPEGEMIARLERNGLSFGADTNAHTTFDETVYKLNLPNVNSDVMDEAFFLMRETASNLTLDQGAIDRERGIIRSEKRTRNSVGFRNTMANWEFFTKGSNLVDRMPIGTYEAIDSLSAPQFRSWYNANYHPEKAFFVFVGDVPAETVIAKIEETFGDWQPQQAPVPIAEPTKAEVRSGDVGYFTDPEIMTSVTLAVKQPYVEKIDTRASRRDRLIDYLATSLINKRLRDLTYEPDTPVISAISGHGSIFGTIDRTALTVRSDVEDWEDALALGEQTLRRSLKYGFSQDELDVQIEELQIFYEKRVKEAETPQTNARRGSGIVDRIISAYGSETVMTHPSDDLARFNEERDTIKLAEVEARLTDMWKGYEDPLVFLTTRELPDDPEAAVKAALDKSRRIDVEPQNIDLQTEFAYTSFGEAGQVAEITDLEALGVTLVRFRNGVKFNFKQTDFSEGQVLVRADVGDGALSLPKKDEGLRRLALNLLSQGGLGQHSKNDLNTILKQYDFNTRLFFSEDSDTIELSGRSTPDELRDLLNYLTAYTADPGARKEAGERYKRSLKSWYPTYDSTPDGVLSKEVPRLIRSGDKRFGFGDLENFIDADYNIAADWLKDQLTKGVIEVTVVGDISFEEALQHISYTFGALPARETERGSYPDMTNLVFPETPDRVSYVHAGEPDKVKLRIYWPAPDGTDVVRNQNMRVLRSVLRNKLVEDIREGEAAAYSPGVGLYRSSVFEEFGYIFVNLDLDTESVDLIVEKTLAATADLHAGNITEDMFLRAAKPLKEDYSSTLQRNSYWLGVLSDAQTGGVGLSAHEVALPALEQMRREDIIELAKDIVSRHGL